MAAQELEAVVRLLAAEIAKAVVRELRAGQTTMLDQTASPLGRKRHCAAARRRVAAGDGSAAIIGRRHLLSKEAVTEELAAASKRPRRTSKPVAPPDELGALRARYDLRRAS